jgi:hypothetical protein
MSVDYTIIDGKSGKETNIDANVLSSHLTEGGFKNVALSPDQQSISFEGPDGQIYDADIQNMIEKNYGSIKNAVPKSVDESSVRPSWRLGIESLPNDDIVRKAYLKSKLATEGFKDIEDKHLIGKGEDWNYFNPNTGKWYALTNAKGFDMSDVTGAIPGLAGMVGATAGGIGGGMMGGLPAVAGSALGGLGARTLEKGLLAQFDPEYLDAYRMSKPGQVLAEEGISTAIDAAVPAVGMIPGVKQAFKSGIVSPIAKVVGKGTEFLGRGVERLGKTFAENRLPRELATTVTPGLGVAQSAGLTARIGEIPFWLTKKVPGAVDKLQKIPGLEEVGSGVRSGAVDLLRPRTLAKAGPEALAEEFASVASGNMPKNVAEKAAASAKENVIKDFYGNVGGKLARAGVGAEEGFNAAKQKILAGRKMGQSFGGGVQDLSNTGKAIEGAADVGMRGLSRGIQYAGAGVKNTGRGLKLGGTVLGPLEARTSIELGGQSLAEEGLDWLKGPKTFTPKAFTQ